MKKIEINTYYFSVDTNWLSDPKISILISELGAISLAIYITTLSWLYLEKGVLNKNHYKYISAQIHCTEDEVRKVIENYNLFYFEENEFSSLRARQDMEKRLAMSKGGAKGGKNKLKNN